MAVRHIFENKATLFWTLQFGGWAGYGLIHFSIGLGVGKGLEYCAYSAAATAVGFLATLAMRHIYRAVRLSHPLLILTTVVLAVALFALLLPMSKFVILGLMYPDPHLMLADGPAKLVFELMPGWAQSWVGDTFGLFAPPLDFWWEVPMAAPLSAYLLLAWSGLYFGINYYLMLQRQTETALKVSAIAQQTQLRLLRYQLNPHFLFNTLNAISTLVLERDTEMANRMITRLSAFLRHSLDTDATQKVTLRQELYALGLYLDIERVRFADRLRVVIDVPDALQEALIPSLLLQPLVENAIKYAVAPQIEGATLRISARAASGGVWLEVADTGPGLDPARPMRPNGVGLANTRERLRQFYGDAHLFDLRPNLPRGLAVRLTIPLEGVPVDAARAGSDAAPPVKRAA